MPGLMITTIGFDADDTLWENEQFFRFTEREFANLLSDHGDPKIVSARLLEAEKRNIGHYGFGAKGFTLSMIETAIKVTNGNVAGSVIGSILEIGRELMNYPVHTLPGVSETLATLSADFTIVLITKGDLFDQERKLAQSGLGDHFDAMRLSQTRGPTRTKHSLPVMAMVRKNR